MGVFTFISTSGVPMDEYGKKNTDYGRIFVFTGYCFINIKK